MQKQHKKREAVLQMLSVENPPPDPPCPCEISQLKGCDERASDKLALPEVDLFNSGLDDTQLPKFSIRDYVFGTRGKDIKKNWPFSQKNLQLCLKHGVKDVLPPFQSLDSVREGSFKGCVAETCLPDKENICNLDSFRNLNGEPSGWVPSSSDSAQPNLRIAADCIDINSSGSGGEKDFPSSTTSNSQSDIGSVHTHRLSSSAVETDTLLEASAELEAAGDLAPHKTESKTQPSAKKCRLIVKLRAVSDPSSTEDIASNCTTLSEAMASKICPVCKTFSSSSNTTLNAHIDQCLSVESTSRWMEDSRQTRHRIKPRKTRLMVDICATAPRCTLEELDRRNGSNWATDLSLPTQNTEVCAHEKRQRLSPVHPEETGDEGAVYIDASGTKVRILSKLNVPSSVSKVGEDPRTSKPLRGSKGSKFFSTNKRKRHVNKYHNYLKVAIQSKKDCSPKPHNSEIHGTREENCGAEDHEEEEHRAHNFKAQEQIKPSDSGTLRQWVCSKRTGLSKKVNGKDGHRRPAYKLRTTQDLAIESDQSCLGDSYVEKNTRRSPNLMENVISSESKKKVENSLNESRGYDDGEQSPGRKRLGSSLFGARISDNVERFQEPLKQNANQLSKENTSVCDRIMLKRTNTIGNHVSPLSNKTSDILAGPVRSPDSSTSANPKPYRSKSLSSKAMKSSTLRKDVLSVHQSFLNKKYSALKKPWVLHSEVEIDEESPSEGDHHYDMMHDHIENQSGVEEINDSVCLDRSSVLEIRQEKGAMGVSQGEDAMVLKRSQASWSPGHDVGENIDSSVRVSDDMTDKCDGLESARKLVQMHAADIVIESSKMCLDRNITTLNKSLGPKFNKLANPPENGSSSLQPMEEYKGPLCEDEASCRLTDPSLGDEQGMFCLDEVGNGIIGQNSFLGADMESKIGQGNTFPEVDPIPIPGPPGSFLPSPRDMGSEDFQGHSSLTTSLVQSSSQDQHDLVDGDSSDSPISATSTISNSTVARPDLKCSEQLSSVRAHSVQERIRSDFSGTSIWPVLENDVTVPEKVSVGAERILLDGGNLKVKVTSSIKGPLSFQDDDQPCCCSRKERTSQGVALNYQESQLLRRRTMASVMLPAIGKQTGCNMNTRPNNLNVSPEMISISNCPSSGSEKVVFPVMKASTDSIPINGSTDAALKIPSHSDCDSASPSGSNPILRLMGKNLMVVNKEEVAPMQLGETQPVPLSNCPNPQFLNFSGVSHGNAQNPDYHYFHHMIPPGSFRYIQDPHNTVGQCSGIRLPNSFEGHCNPKTPQALEGMFPNKHIGGAFAASLGPHDYKGEYNLVTQQNRPTTRLGATPVYHMEKATNSPHPQYRNSSSMGSSIKDVIIIDDTPESEADSTTDDAKYTKCLRESQVPLADNLIPAPPNYNLRHLNPLSRYQSQDPSPLGESPTAHSNCFIVPPSRRTNTSPVKWGCTSESSGIIQRNPFMASSSSTGHLRPDLYYSPSLS